MIDLLEFLWPHYGFGELRIIGDLKPVEREPPYTYKPRVDQYFFSLLPKDRDSCIMSIDRMSRTADEDGRDVYVGVLPRTEARGTADACSQFSSVLWADVDAKAHDDGSFSTGGKGRALRAILDFPVPASVILDTGHGYHAYWKLTTTEPFESCRAAMEGIAKRVKGDSVYDAARIMRLPGLHNHKEHTAIPVRLLRLDTTEKYSIHDFDEFLVGQAWLASLPREIKGTFIFGEHSDIPAKLAEWIELDPGKGKRSEHVFRVARWLMGLGYSDQEIGNVILTNPYGVGAKCYEIGKKQGDRWLSLTLRKARAAL